MTAPEHAPLLDALNAHPGVALLSGYRTPLYDAALPHWRRVDLPAAAEHGRSRVECLWIKETT